MVRRRRVSSSELLEILNRRLAAYEEAEDCHFVGPILPLTELDEEGCNWSRQLSVRCSGREADQYLGRVASKVIDEVAAEYNLVAE